MEDRKREATLMSRFPSRATGPCCGFATRQRGRRQVHPGGRLLIAPSRCWPTKSRPSSAPRWKGSDTPDSSLLVDDGLARSGTGITIDVAYATSAPHARVRAGDTPATCSTPEHGDGASLRAGRAAGGRPLRVVEQTRRQRRGDRAWLRVPRLVLGGDKIDLWTTTRRVHRHRRTSGFGHRMG